ncbi:hypothetical protein F01_380014 [Burkholderia cenocepacia]|nr:hypothetical protein F01_380014 [Burkholderia cenocepacia]
MPTGGFDPVARFRAENSPFYDPMHRCNGVWNAASSLSRKALGVPVNVRYLSRIPVSPVSASGA